ncbi:MAG TPA: hypothetical protein VGD58_12895 [Herpetosiphonaceae bacterium]
MQASTLLLFVLWFKIIVTLVFWSVPLLFLRQSFMQRLGIPVPEPFLFIRLLGGAYMALVVGYGLGVRDVQLNRDVTDTVWVGIVSNGLACIILLYYGYAGAWKAWRCLAQIYMALSALLTGGITLGLIWSGLLAGGATGEN